MKVLIVEDYDILRRMIIEDLEETLSGIEVYGAENGDEGLNFVARVRPEVVITDISLRGIDGIEMMKQILAQNCGTRVIVMSGLYDHRDIVDIQKIIQSGAVKFVPKSSDITSELIDSVAALMEQLIPSSESVIT